MLNSIYCYKITNRRTKQVMFYGGESKDLNRRIKEHEKLNDTILNVLYKRNTNIEYEYIELKRYNKVLTNPKEQQRRRKTKETLLIAYFIKKGLAFLNTRQVKQAQTIADNTPISVIKKRLGKDFTLKLENFIQKA